MRKLWIKLLIMSVITSLGSAGAEMSLEGKGGNQVARIVISKMLETLPNSVHQVCVMKVDLFKSELTTSMMLDINDIDSRILTDISACSGENNSPTIGATTLLYFGDMSEVINKIEKPGDPTFQGAFELVKNHIKKGHLVVGSAFNECGAEGHTFVFEYDTSGGRLIETAVIGQVECFVLKKN